MQTVPELIAEAVQLPIIHYLDPLSSILFAVAGAIHERRRAELSQVISADVIGLLVHRWILLVAQLVTAVGQWSFVPFV